MPTLKSENTLFEKHINEWRISHMGAFVLIKSQDLIGFFATLDEAFNEGLKRFGVADFLVEQIKPIESVNVTFYGRVI
jgi:hypothetical protein